MTSRARLRKWVVCGLVAAVAGGFWGLDRILYGERYRQ